MSDMKAIVQVLSKLRDEDVRLYLIRILSEIRRLQEQSELLEEPLNEPISGPVTGLLGYYSLLMDFPEKQKRSSYAPSPDCTHVHIVCGDSFAGSMKQALSGLGWSRSHKLIVLRGDYTMGPLRQLDLPEGREARSSWFRENITEYMTISYDYEEEYNQLLDTLEQIPDQAKIVLWTSNNASEQTGLRLAIHLLGGRDNPVVVCDACAICEELYNRPDASMIYRHSGEIQSDKLQEALRRILDCSMLTPDEITRLKREWLEISEQSHALRIWQDNAVLEVPADYFDAYLLEKLDGLNPPAGSDGFLKSARLIGEALGYCEQYVGDAFFEYRVRELIYSGVLEIKGVPAAMRFYSIRRKRGT